LVPADGAAEFLEKITFDLAAGQQQVPLLYKEIYSTQTDANFPLTLTEKTIGDVQTVFLEKFEGGEISFGAVGSGEEVTVKMHTYASGIEYDEDIAEYNQTWRVASIGESFGRSYNQLLNHLHLSAIVNATFAAGTAYNASQSYAPCSCSCTEGLRWHRRCQGQLVLHSKLQVTSANAATWKAVVQVCSLVVQSSCTTAFDEIAIRNAFAQDVIVVGNTNTPGVAQRTLGNATLVAYDGDIITVGEDVYEYEGVAQGEAFVLVPKQNFKEYVKHDLRTDSGDGDLEPTRACPGGRTHSPGSARCRWW
jgi:hypothetical protein